MNCAVIPARGGSKRIPGKNLKNFNGKPIILYSIAACFESDMFDKIYVSTDDPEIGKLATNNGCEVIYRPPHLSDDFTNLSEVMADVAKVLKPYNAICMVYATAPMVRSKDISNSRSSLNRPTNYVVAIAPYAYPIWRSFKITQNKTLEMLYPHHRGARSQDLPTVYHDAAHFIWGWQTSWESSQLIFDTNSIGFQIPPERVQDLDTLEDWAVAELKWQILNRHGA